ncbi:MAG: hypothetical protein KY054_02420 [Candidatus Nealsonbacteria bacterium]|nr:hypothetical protein [Candidatus Nealsonbacteria bacterium]
MLSKILKFVKDYQDDIILFLGVVLVSFLAFALGYITAKNQEKPHLEFEEFIYEKSGTYRYHS